MGSKSAQDDFIAGLASAEVAPMDDGNGYVVLVTEATGGTSSLPASIRAAREAVIGSAAVAMWRQVLSGHVEPIARGRVLVVAGAERTGVHSYRVSDDGTDTPDWVSPQSREPGRLYYWVSEWTVTYRYSTDPAAREAYGYRGILPGLNG